ncbi:unnamed protein product [Meloidogyne enterolobii]|uniref:Uncharacterized protein n=1 Tax=Meloidogyne enterolobii TaxID=390850 RepID=A0ACB0XU49_MELEN
MELYINYKPRGLFHQTTFTVTVDKEKCQNKLASMIVRLHVKRSQKNLMSGRVSESKEKCGSEGSVVSHILATLTVFNCVYCLFLIIFN